MESIKDKVTAANEYVLERMQETDPYWVGMKPAIE